MGLGIIWEAGLTFFGRGSDFFGRGCDFFWVVEIFSGGVDYIREELRILSGRGGGLRIIGGGVEKFSGG